MRFIDEGIAAEVLDAAAVAFGMPMGPIELVDTVGLDVAKAVGEQLARSDNPPKKILELVAAGKLGKKSGEGFYKWVDGKPQKVRAGGTGHGDAALAKRLIKPLVAAAQRLVAEGVVADGDLADAGVIFGTGFAPFRGGPINYAKSAT